MVELTLPQIILAIVLGVLAYSTWRSASVLLPFLCDRRPTYDESRHRQMHRAAPALEPRRLPGPGLVVWVQLWVQLAFILVFGWLYFTLFVETGLDEACRGDRS